MNFVPGQEVFFVSRDSRHRKTGFVKIAKVGRQWVTLENSLRFDKSTLKVDGKGYSPPGVIYLSKQEYDDQTEKNILSMKLASFFGLKGEGKKLPLEALRQIKEIIDAHD